MMKKKFLLLCLLISAAGVAQVEMLNMSNIDTLFVKSYWGNIEIKGNSANRGQLQAIHVNSKGKRQPILSSHSERFFTTSISGRTLRIKAQEPNGFESLDFSLEIPKKVFVKAELIKGGEIILRNLHNGIEVNQLNGSLRASNLGEYAMVNLANGSIDMSFQKLNPNKPVSLVTMNGGITVRLPEGIKREVRLISRKNGYLRSDFNLTGVMPKVNMNVREYSKKPIEGRVKINGGGQLLFLSTENGPIEILKN